MQKTKLNEIKESIEKVGGLAAFGHVFAAVMQKQVEQGGWVVAPDEFFFGAKEETVKLYREKQCELDLWFFREHMGNLNKDHVAFTLSILPKVDISDETYAELVAACNDPGNRYHNDDEVQNTKQEALKVLNRSLYSDLNK